MNTTVLYTELPGTMVAHGLLKGDGNAAILPRLFTAQTREGA